MPLMIGEDCTQCAACEEECPPEAIAPGDDTYMIDANQCDECVGVAEGPLCIAACPIGCIAPDPTRAAA